MEPLFIQNGVDIAVFGHIHSMERSYPVTYDATSKENIPSTIYICLECIVNRMRIETDNSMLIAANSFPI